MILKKEFIEKVISYINSNSHILLIDSNNEADLVKLVLRIITKEVSTPLNIAFFSSSDLGFREVFSNTKTPIRTWANYNLAQHKISFYVHDKQLLKYPPTAVDYIIIHPSEEIAEKEIIEYINKLTNCKKFIIINKGSAPKFKAINKLSPLNISAKVDESTAYYNLIKNRINNSK